MRKTTWILFIIATMAGPLCWGQPGEHGEQSRGGPNLGVARVSVADGDVAVKRTDSGDLVQARGGMPLLADDSITTGGSSRAEVQLGRANFLRLSDESMVKIIELGNLRYRVEVVKGTVTYSQLRGGEADVDIEFPTASVRPLKNGVYRIVVREGVQSDVTVRKGEAEIVSPQGIEVLKKGRRMTIRGSANDAEFRRVKADREDSFDLWSRRRDNLLNRDGSYQSWGWPPYLYPYHLGFGYGWGYGGYGYGYGGYGYRRPLVIVRAPVGGRGGHRGRR